MELVPYDQNNHLQVVNALRLSDQCALGHKEIIVAMAKPTMLYCQLQLRNKFVLNLKGYVTK